MKQDSGIASGSDIGNSQGNPVPARVGESQKTGSPSTGKETGRDAGDSRPATKDSGNSDRNGKDQGSGEKAGHKEGKDSGTKDKGTATGNGTGSKNGHSKNQAGTGNSTGSKPKAGAEISPENKPATIIGKLTSDGNTASAKNISGKNGSGGKNTATGNLESQSVTSDPVNGRTTGDGSTGGRQWNLTDTKAGNGVAVTDNSSHTDLENSQGDTAPSVTSLPDNSPQVHVDAGNGSYTGGAVGDRQNHVEDSRTAAGSETGNHSMPPALVFLGTLLVVFLCLVLAFCIRRKRKDGRGE